MAFILSFSISANAQSNQNSKLEEAKKAIAESNALYFKSSEQNDPSIFVNSYANDACVLPPNAPIVCGKEALEKFFKTSYENGIRGGRFVTLDVFGDGIEYVTEIGTGQVWGADKKIMDDFKYLVLWKKTKDGWKMYRDSFSSNLPASRK